MGACLGGRRARWWGPLLFSVLALVTIVGALTAAAVVVVEQTLAGVTRAPDLLPPRIDGENLVTDGPMTILVLGSDDRYDGGGGRSDAIMVVRISADRHHVGVISIPRDLYVPIPGHRRNKVNAALAFGGVPLTVQTVEALLQVRVDHVALVDMAGFVKLADELGGVSVYNHHASRSGGYDFPVGQVKLDGQRALAYVRERRQLPRGDLDRAERQRSVVIAMARTALQHRQLQDISGVHRFVRHAGGTIVVDEQFTVVRMHRLLCSLRHSKVSVSSLEVPVAGFATGPGGMAIDVVDEPGLRTLVRALKRDTLDGYRPAP